MKLRGVLLGCGGISEFHLRGWNRIPEVEIAALGDRTLARAAERRDQFAPGARMYSDLATMLDAEQPDFVDILTPPAQHLEHCRLASERGVHIICQKPLADTRENARAIANMARGYGRIFAVHENHRYRPWFRSILQEIQAGNYGTIAFAQFLHLNGSGPAAAFKRESEAGVLLEYGSHLVDMMRAALGEPRRVYASLVRLNPDVRGESLAHAVFEFDGNRTAVVSVAWKQAGLTQGSVVLCGERLETWYEGTLTRGDASRLRTVAGSAPVLDEQRSSLDDYVESFFLLQREATDAMLGQGTVVQTAEEHMRTLACTFAAYESARRGKPIEVAEFVSATQLT